MKQLVYMIAATLAGSIGTFVVHPSWGVFVYYHFAVLRPQFLWDWSLPPEVSWSLYVAVPVLAAAPMGLVGMWGSGGWRASHLPVILFGAWTTLTYFFAYDRDVAYPWMIDNLKIYVMFAASALLLTSVRQLWYLHLMAAASIGYIAYEVNVQYFANGFIRIARDGYGGMTTTGAALILAMGIPLCISAWEGMQGKLRWVFLGFVPLLLHAVMMTFSRGAMLSLAVATPLFVWRSRYRTRMALVMAVLGLVGVPLMAGKEIRERFASIEEHETDGSANERLDAWKAAWNITLAHPITGVGTRNSPQMLMQYGGLANRTVHSQYLQLSADAGFVGLGLYLLVVAATWRNVSAARRMTLEAGGDAQVEAMANGMQTTLLVFSVGGIFLSLETFELTYLIFLIGAQLPSLTESALDSEDAGDEYTEVDISDFASNEAVDEKTPTAEKTIP